MHQFTIIKNEDGSNNVLLLGHGEPLVAHSSHANYKTIVDTLVREASPNYGGDFTDTATWAALFDTGRAVEERFRALSERVSVEGGTILLDGDPLEDAFVEPILKFLDEGIEDWKPLVAFLESVAANPSVNSRSQLSEWVGNQEGITLTAEGNIVGYKGVNRNGDGSLVSVHSTGTATVQRPGEDPVTITGPIPNEVGSIVTMPRSEVVDDPNAHCHRGLHVGTQRYATSYARNGVMLEVHVSPRDVVSVPNDANGEKIRVCRYTIVKVLEPGFKYDGPLRPDDAVESLDDDEPLSDINDVAIEVGQRVVDEEGDQGVIVTSDTADLGLAVEYDNEVYGKIDLDGEDEVTDLGLEVIVKGETPKTTPLTPGRAQTRASDGRPHGKGGATSLATKGTGRNPAQDAKGRFSAGRPRSQRDPNTGRFIG